jgi:hypothetical protein
MSEVRVGNLVFGVGFLEAEIQRLKGEVSKLGQELQNSLNFGGATGSTKAFVEEQRKLTAELNTSKAALDRLAAAHSVGTAEAQKRTAQTNADTAVIRQNTAAINQQAAATNQATAVQQQANAVANSVLIATQQQAAAQQQAAQAAIQALQQQAAQQKLLTSQQQTAAATTQAATRVIQQNTAQVNLGTAASRAATAATNAQTATVRQGTAQHQQNAAALRTNTAQQQAIAAATRAATAQINNQIAALRLQNAQIARNNATTRVWAGSLGLLRNTLGGFGIALGAAATAQGTKAYLGFLENSALDAQAAANALKIYAREVQLAGQSASDGAGLISRLSEQFIVNEDAVARGAVTLFRMGATAEQVELLLQRGGASALAFGKSAETGFEAIGQAIAGQNSQILNYIGIAGNISTENIRMAKSLGIATDELNDQERVQAAVNLVLRETNQEYAALPTVLGGIIGQKQELNTELKELRRNLGEDVNPNLVEMYESLNDLIDALQRARPVILEMSAAIVDGFSRAIDFAARSIDFLQQKANELNFSAVETGLENVERLDREIARFEDGQLTFADRLANAVTGDTREDRVNKLLEQRATAVEDLTARYAKLTDAQRAALGIPQFFGVSNNASVAELPFLAPPSNFPTPTVDRGAGSGSGAKSELEKQLERIDERIQRHRDTLDGFVTANSLGRFTDQHEVLSGKLSETTSLIDFLLENYDLLSEEEKGVLERALEREALYIRELETLEKLAEKAEEYADFLADRAEVLSNLPPTQSNIILDPVTGLIIDLEANKRAIRQAAIETRKIREEEYQKLLDSLPLTPGVVVPQGSPTTGIGSPLTTQADINEFARENNRLTAAQIRQYQDLAKARNESNAAAEAERREALVLQNSGVIQNATEFNKQYAETFGFLSTTTQDSKKALEEWKNSAEGEQWVRLQTVLDDIADQFERGRVEGYEFSTMLQNLNEAAARSLQIQAAAKAGEAAANRLRLTTEEFTSGSDAKFGNVPGQVFSDEWIQVLTEGKDRAQKLAQALKEVGEELEAIEEENALKQTETAISQVTAGVNLLDTTLQLDFSSVEAGIDSFQNLGNSTFSFIDTLTGLSAAIPGIGGLVSAGLSLIGSLFDLFTRRAREAEEEMKRFAEESKNTFESYSKNLDFSTYIKLRKIVLDDEGKRVIETSALDIASSFVDAVTAGFRNGPRAFDEAINGLFDQYMAELLAKSEIMQKYAVEFARLVERGMKDGTLANDRAAFEALRARARRDLEILYNDARAAGFFQDTGTTSSPITPERNEPTRPSRPQPIVINRGQTGGAGFSSAPAPQSVQLGVSTAWLRAGQEFGRYVAQFGVSVGQFEGAVSTLTESIANLRANGTGNLRALRARPTGA